MDNSTTSNETPLPELNNIYLVDAGWHRMDVEYIPDVGTVRDDVYCWGLYCAPTRGKAKAYFIQAYDNDFEWTDKMSIRCVAKNIAAPEGEAPYNAWVFSDPTTSQFPLARLAAKQGRIPTNEERDYIEDALIKMQPGIARYD